MTHFCDNCGSHTTKLTAEEKRLADAIWDSIPDDPAGIAIWAKGEPINAMGDLA